MNKFALLLLLIVPFLFLFGCNAKRELKTAVCFAKSQPSEDACLEKLAIDTKDTVPCDRIKSLHLSNGTIILPTKVTCYAEVAFWKGEENICNQLPLESDKTECKARYELYLDTARQ